jgi:hypothetical protein
VHWWWSWLLTAVGVTGLYFAGRKRAVGWAIGLAAQGLWIAYALTTRQWGFLLSAAIYGWVYGLNFLRWRTEPASVPEKDS